jgi:hypothetical protein
MSVTFQTSTLVINGKSIQMPWAVLEAVEHEDKIFVLLDPDSYLLDSEYKKMRRQGAPVVKNLLAFNKSGVKLWEADMPEPSDYYYLIGSASPLFVNSFSSYRCEIEPTSGKIINKEFLK